MGNLQKKEFEKLNKEKENILPFNIYLALFPVLNAFLISEL
jgi:hypothetical protein